MGSKLTTWILVAAVAGIGAGWAGNAFSPDAAAAAQDKAATNKAKQAQVGAATADKGYTQRAGEQAAQAEGTGASARAARRAASRENVKNATADKGYTQRAGDAAAQAAEEKKKEQAAK